MMNTKTANLFRLQCWAFAIASCGVAANDVVGLEVTEGQIVTEIDCPGCTSITGDGVETVTIRSETSNYDIERSATAIISEEFGVEEVGRVELKFEHSPTWLRIDGIASGAWGDGADVESSLSGTVDFTLDGVRPTEIVRWYGELANAQLAKRNGQVVFTCEGYAPFGPTRCFSPNDTELIQQEFLLPAGEYRLTFSSHSYYEAGNGVPGILHFKMILVPEPSTCIGALTGTLLCCWASRHSRRSRQVHIAT